MTIRKNDDIQVNKIVSFAIDFLKKNPFDEGHDLSHHKGVLKIAENIAKNINLQIDKEVLKIAVMWHDVKVTKGGKWSLQKKHNNMFETLKYLENLLSSLKFPLDKKLKIIDAIKGHEFGNKQLNIEGKILFDADKLNALDPMRWQKIIDAVKSKKMNKFQMKIYAKIGTIWVKTMRGKLNYDYSKTLFDKMIRQLANNPSAQTIALDFGLDLKKDLGFK